MINPSVENNISINSKEKSFHWIIISFGILFLAASAALFNNILEQYTRGNEELLFTLLFPLAGLFMCISGFRARKKFLTIGVTPLTPSPPVGQIGGQIGGSIELRQVWQKRKLTVYLSCIHTYSSGSGKNTSTHTDVVWQHDNYPVDKPHPCGSILEFCFDVPSDLPVDGRYQGKGRIDWEIMIEGQVNDQEFKRHWKIPVEAGTGQSSIFISDIHKETSKRVMREQAEESVNQQIQFKATSNGVSIISEQGRNKSMSYSVAVFGLIFSGVGVFLLYLAAQGDFMLWIIAPFFLGFGLLTLLFGIFLIGRKLECKIVSATVFTRRSVFSVNLYRREGPLNSAKQLKLKSTMSSTQGSKKTQYMALYASVKCTDGKTRDLKLVEGIEGRRAGEAMERKVAELISEYSR